MTRCPLQLNLALLAPGSSPRPASPLPYRPAMAHPIDESPDMGYHGGYDDGDIDDRG